MQQRQDSSLKQTDNLVGCIVALAAVATAIGIWMHIPLLVAISPVALVFLGWGIYRHARAGAAREEGRGSEEG